jgi:hypothetical protein
MRTIALIVFLFGLLAFSLWFLGAAWIRFDGDAMPLYGWIAIAGGVVFSLIVGGGLMALSFYSARHGYDDSGDGRPQA